MEDVRPTRMAIAFYSLNYVIAQGDDLDVGAGLEHDRIRRNDLGHLLGRLAS